MDLKLTNFEDVTPDKVAFVESEANKLLSFLLESRELLNREAHTTLQWLFGLIVASVGYVVTLLDADTGVRWWLVGPVVGAALVASVEAIRLFWRALRAQPVMPPGNEPANLATSTMMAYEAHWMRLAEVAQLQERIDSARNHNCRVAAAINEARCVLALLPLAVLLLIYFCWRII